MTDLTKLTADELRRIANDLISADGRDIAAVDELHRRAQANALVQADRDEFDEELHKCRAIVGATSEHLHVDLEELVEKLRGTEADSRSWQELATARAQANERLREVAQAVARSHHSFDDLVVVHVRRVVWQQLSEALAAAPDTPPTPAAPVTDAEVEAFITACTNIDWGQHLLNQGGCFHVEDGRLCGRARTWAGHQGGDHLHLFVPLYVAVTKIARAYWSQDLNGTVGAKRCSACNPERAAQEASK